MRIPQHPPCNYECHPETEGIKFAENDLYAIVVTLCDKIPDTGRKSIEYSVDYPANTCIDNEIVLVNRNDGKPLGTRKYGKYYDRGTLLQYKGGYLVIEKLLRTAYDFGVITPNVIPLLGIGFEPRVISMDESFNKKSSHYTE